MKVTARHVTTRDHQRVFELAGQAALDFARIGFVQVAAACNAEREAILAVARTQPAVTAHGSTFASSLVQTELGDPFELLPPPDELFIDFSQPHANCPMSARRPCVWMHMAHIDVEGALCPTVGMTIADTMLHEMLHVCGEVRHDGIIRYNWAGALAIRQLLDSKGGS